ncbi:hypothetical protein BJ165DRAFT_1616322 [Panaeolus papilionaceus]|nr:hypothetical protein BJ165DRAFT_1616322 [Panaeolus papilionaceus]
MSKPMAPSCFPNIPFDVLDLILDFVSSVLLNADVFEDVDRKTVSALAAWRSTCRYFNVMVRPRLWRVIAMDDKDNRVHRFKELRELLDTSPEIGGFVQSFAYRTTPASAAARDNPQLVAILPQFTKLKDFQFECNAGVFRWTDLHRDIRLAFSRLCLLPTLAVIELRGVKDVPPSLITSCQSLERLMMRDVFFDASIGFLKSVIGDEMPPQIKKLELWPRVTSSEILALNAFHMFSKIQSLALSVFDQEDLQTALAVMDSAKQTVRHLKIGGTYLLDKSDVEAWKCQLDLEQLVSLEHIRTYYVMDTDAYAAKCFPRSLIVLLDRSQPSLTVKSLHIYLKIYVLGSELMLHLKDGWEGLDDVVTTKYPNLQILRLEFISLFASAPKEDELLVRKHIRSVLPKTVASGAIKVQVITDTGMVWDL